MNPYTYHSSNLNVNLQLRQTTKKWLRYTVDFPTAFPTTSEENKTVFGEYFQPRNTTKSRWLSWCMAGATTAPSPAISWPEH